MRIVWLLIAILAITGLLVATRPSGQAELRDSAAVRVTAATVSRRDVTPVVLATGQLRPSRLARLHFEIAGRITGRLVEPGQSVAAGQALLRIDAGDLDDAVAQARAAYTREQAAVNRDRRLLKLAVRQRELQQAELQRLQKLGEQSLASKSGRDLAEKELLRLQEQEIRLQFSVTTAAARLSEREALLDQARRNRQRAVLTSPFAATVNAVAFDTGDYATPAQMAVELVQLTALDLSVDVAGATARALQPGQGLDVEVDGQHATGSIIAVARDPDQQTHTHRVRIRVAGSAWGPGQIATVQLPLATLRRAQLLPLSAVLREDGVASVFQVRDGKVWRTPVTVVHRIDDQLAIKGLSDDALVVTRDIAALSDGLPVEPVAN